MNNRVMIPLFPPDGYFQRITQTVVEIDIPGSWKVMEFKMLKKYEPCFSSYGMVWVNSLIFLNHSVNRVNRLIEHTLVKVLW